jgi:hypothetical protein
MHDTDRVLTEHESNYEADHFEFSDESEYGGQGESIFNEVEETELASQFLEITDENELDQFLGSFLKKAARKLGGVIRSPIGQMVVGHIKGAAKKYLPMAKQAVESKFGGIGGGLFDQATSRLGLEAEDSGEAEFEMAKDFVRFASAAASNAAAATPSGNPAVAAKNAVIDAARQHVPALVSPNGAGRPGARRGARSGRWVRRGHQIVLLGV